MKFSDLLQATVQLRPLLVRPEQAALLLGSGEVVADFIQAGWLEPVISEHRLVLYAYKHLDLCVRRLESGEIPLASGDSQIRPARVPKSLFASSCGSFDGQLRGVIKVEPFLLRPEAASLFVGTGALLEKFRRSGWIKPLYDRHRLVLYSARQLADCVARIEVGDRPGHEGKSKVGATTTATAHRRFVPAGFPLRKARRTRRPMPVTA